MGRKKHRVHRVRRCQQFQASPGGVRMKLPRRGMMVFELEKLCSEDTESQRLSSPKTPRLAGGRTRKSFGDPQRSALFYYAIDTSSEGLLFREYPRTVTTDHVTRRSGLCRFRITSQAPEKCQLAYSNKRKEQPRLYGFISQFGLLFNLETF